MRGLGFLIKTLIAPAIAAGRARHFPAGLKSAVKTTKS
jgi:hypothetical protein